LKTLISLKCEGKGGGKSGERAMGGKKGMRPRRFGDRLDFDGRSYHAEGKGNEYVLSREWKGGERHREGGSILILYD